MTNSINTPATQSSSHPVAGGGGGEQPARASEQHRTKETIQDTLISIVIAFALAFVFRGFVVEAFVIPTGSMAPTLMGAHERFRSEQSGYTWPVGPWDYKPGTSDQQPMPIQGRRGRQNQNTLLVHDPMTGEPITGENMRLLSGDRILVLKYLYSIHEPSRFDVVVFKNPGEPDVNFIKRLIGLPGEQIAIADGDIFVRRSSTAPAAGDSEPQREWSEPGWTIARKSAQVQRAVWQPVFDSQYAPLEPARDGRTWYSTPWTTEQPGWAIEARRIYEYAGSGPTDLVWDSQRKRYQVPGSPPEHWTIDDRYPYNDGARNRSPTYPVSDIRMSAGIEPSQAGLGVTATVMARGHEFQARLAEGSAVLRYRPESASGALGEWTTLATVAHAAFAPGRVTNLEFWHADQTLQLWVDGRLVARAEYDWSPSSGQSSPGDRIRCATGYSVEDLLRREDSGGRNVLFISDPTSGVNVRLYKDPRPRWTFEGGPLKLHRVAIDRDLFYQPGITQTGAARGTHPHYPVTLLADQFFVCGDNSPASHDGRLWSGPDPWVAEIDPAPGVVPRKLMLGKAFFVYFPSLIRTGIVPVPDFGRMRFIW